MGRDESESNPFPCPYRTKYVCGGNYDDGLFGVRSLSHVTTSVS